MTVMRPPVSLVNLPMVTTEEVDRFPRAEIAVGFDPSDGGGEIVVAVWMLPSGKRCLTVDLGYQERDAAQIDRLATGVAALIQKRLTGTRSTCPKCKRIIGEQGHTCGPGSRPRMHKEVCGYGHPMTPENTRLYTQPKTGYTRRSCRQCQADSQRARQAANVAAGLTVMGKVRKENR